MQRNGPEFREMKKFLTSKRRAAGSSPAGCANDLHKIRRAMVAPDRQPLAGRAEADETYLGAAKPGRAGRGAVGKAKVAGAVESGRGKSRGRRLGRLRLATVPDVSAQSLE